ncbi:MAG: SEC-C metal-binding domain-containing protein, partial [Dehalococcoidia bacterium]
KEGVRIQRESITYATITIQNYFRLYQKLAGMTGTAYTEREEFNTIYNLDVAVIPTHKPMIREDSPDVIYRSEEGKFQATVAEIEESHSSGQPLLVGTVSIEKSEHLADLLKRTSTCRNQECSNYHQVCPLKEPQVLNAKHHEREAAIIAQAGRYAGVTIATNMAGRGTDIILGGNPERLADELARKRGLDLIQLPAREAEGIRQEAQALWQAEHEAVVAAGGLHIVGTERHEARRIDNQLRGRSGRQGDPGSSRFFVSFEDDVMRRFAPDWVPNFLGRMGMDEDTPLESGMVSKAIEQAQTKVEGYNFDIRKHVVEYDDVMNTHRDLIYKERHKILGGADLKANIQDMIEEEVDSLLETFAPDGSSEGRDLADLLNELGAILPLPSHFTESRLGQLPREELREEILRYANEAYEAKEEQLSADKMRVLERLLMLGTIDQLWIYHLTALDEMRQGAGLHGYGGQDPLVVYKREAHDMWDQLTYHIRQGLVKRIYQVTLSPQAAPAPRPPSQVQERGPAKENVSAAPTRRALARASPTTSSARKVGRNDPCPCGSGRKYKKCCGSGVAA